MNLKKHVSAAMAAIMTLSVTATPVLAAVDDAPSVNAQADDTDTDATLGEQSAAEEDRLGAAGQSEQNHQSTTVYAAANGSYILTVPESINLHNIEKNDLGSGLYTNDKHCKVNLRGDVRQDQVVVVTVTEPVMQSEGSKNVDATVDTSSKTVWNRDDLFAGAAAGEDGTYSEPTGVTTIYPVSAELTPGDWVGTAMFNCSLETTSSIASMVTGIDPSSFDYDGQEHTPSLIFANGASLVEGKDYVISGDTAKVEEGDYTLTVTGSGIYAGAVSFDWKIKKYDIATAVSGLDNSVFEEDGDTHTPNITWKDGYYLKEGVDYELSGTTSSADGGNYTITITGKGKYKGTLDLEWKVASKPDIALAVSGITPVHFDYDGDTHSPALVWNEGYENLVEGQDYIVSGDRSKSANGNYTIKVTGKGKYKGTASFNWSIGELIPVNAVYTITYTGKQLVGDGVFVCFPLKAYSKDTYVDEDYTYTYYNQDSLHVPGWTVSIKDRTKSSYRELRSYICDKSVTTMNDTFSGCTSLTEAPAIPDSVTHMDDTFANCTSLVKAPVIGNSVTYMAYAFSGCTSLVEAPVIPNSVTDMNYTFSGCTSLTEAPVITEGIANLYYTFENCSSLAVVPVIPSSVTDMNNTFSGCTSLTEAPVIPNSVTNMYGTFSGCTSLTDAPVIPDSVTILDGTFADCTSLTAAPVIPDSVTGMQETFAGCTSLTGTLICNANPDYCSFALFGTNITAIEGLSSDETKSNLLQSRYDY